MFAYIGSTFPMLTLSPSNSSNVPKSALSTVRMVSIRPLLRCTVTLSL